MWHKILGLVACRQPTSMLWRDTNLVVHALIDITRLALHKGAVRTHKRGSTSHDSTRVSFCESPAGNRHKNPSQSSIGAGNNHHLPLNDPPITRPARWRQSPRVTKSLTSPIHPTSATRCKSLMQCTRGSPISHKWQNQGCKWVECVLLCSQGLLSWMGFRRVTKAGHTTYL
jgi:hypothetical protein